MPDRCVMSLLLAMACAAVSAAPRAIVDRSLARTDVDLVGWDGSEIAYRDDLGRLQREPVQNVLAVLPSHAAAGWDLRHPGSIDWIRPGDDRLAGGTPVIVELVDGQRLIGSVGPWDSASVGDEPMATGETAEPGELVGVYSDAAGVRTVPLDRVSRVLIDPWSRLGDAPAFDPGVDDVLVFANGDRLGGFLLAFGETIAFDDGVSERTFALEQVAEVRLGNPAEAGGAPRVWARGGEVLESRSLGFETTGRVRLRGSLDAGPTSRDLADILAAHPTGSATIPLASLEQIGSAPASGRRWASPPRAGSTATAPLGTPHVALPGPMRAEWRLPPDASRFGTVIRLGGRLGDPLARPGPWAHALVRVLVETRDGEHELVSATLDRGTPTLPIAVGLPAAGEFGRALVIELTEGLYGPVQDRVLLDHPMLATD